MKKIFLIIISAFLLLIPLSSCGPSNQNTTTEEPFVEKDYVSLCKFNASSRKSAIVTVKTYIDGDTTHFNINDSTFDGGVLKARYLAVDTPESTGLIEEYGKQASKFTRSKLENAYQIMVESNDDNWNTDSTQSRYLVFVWYKETASSDWRCLNVELLQNGLAFAKNTLNNVYGEEYCMPALNQAKHLKLKAYSGEKDPEFYYGEAKYYPLKYIRTHLEELENTSVAFDGVVTRNYNNGVYIENYDEESGLYFGIYVYYGNGAKQQIMEALNIGNSVRCVGKVQNFNGSWQVSGLQYDASNVGGINTEVIRDDTLKDHFDYIAEDKFYQAPYTEISVNDFLTKKIELEFLHVDEEGNETIEKKEFDYSFLLLATSVSFKELKVKSIYTTTNDESASKGAMTLTCSSQGKEITVRTIVLKNGSGQTLTESVYNGKTINVRGIVDYYESDYDGGLYQIKILRYTDIKESSTNQTLDFEN